MPIEFLEAFLGFLGRALCVEWGPLANAIPEPWEPLGARFKLGMSKPQDERLGGHSAEWSASGAFLGMARFGVIRRNGLAWDHSSECAEKSNKKE